METAEDRYLREHSTGFGESLEWIVKQTNIRTNYPRMLCGPIQGRFLTMLVEISNARKVLEIGTFTGYSAACIALGLPQDGHVDTIEINDELESIAATGWEKAGVAGKITQIIGDALKVIPSLQGPYDFVYIDANKREYKDYYNLVINKVRNGGLILVDDVLWDGRPWMDPVPKDGQTQGITDLNDRVAGDPRVEVVLLSGRHGLSLIRKK